jgi:flagellar motor switch/type III secretory pathway protein FliN
MATTQALPNAAGVPRSGAAPPAAAAQPENVQALVPAPRPPEKAESSIFSGPVARLPVELEVGVPVRDFRVRDLLALAPGSVIGSQWSHDTDLPLAAGPERLAWSEFEVVETRLAVRVTRLE